MQRDIDVAPSTYDTMYPPIAGASPEAEKDLTLSTLESALERIEGGWTSSAYYRSFDNSVCAVGAVLVADGLELETDEDRRTESIGYLIESKLSDAAKEAMTLLCEVSLELFPDASDTTWTNELEHVNQQEGMAAVESVYREAIRRRRELR